MNALAHFPDTPHMPAVARILARFEREQLAGFIAVALDLIDTLDGDADFEDEGEAEPDDPGEDDDIDTGIEDHPRGFDPEEDLGAEERGEPEEWAEPLIADPDAHREQMLRVQQTRCISLRDRYTHRVHGNVLLHDPTVPTKSQLLRRKRGVPKRPRG